MFLPHCPSFLLQIICSYFTGLQSPDFPFNVYMIKDA